MTHTMTTLKFITHDETQISYTHWAPAEKQIDPKKVVVMFHRGHEHSKRMAHIVAELGLPDYQFFAWDARGHGDSQGPRGFSPNVATVVSDIQAFIAHICKEHNLNIEDLIILGQSVGAVTVSTWLHDYAPKVKGTILASPAFSVKLYVPLAIPALRVAKIIRKQEFYVNSYVKGKFLSHDPQRIKEYDTDPKISRPISVSMLIDLFDTSKRIVSDAHQIKTPILLLISGSDYVVRKEPQYEFFAKLGSAKKEVYELPGFYHDTLGEQNRQVAFAKIKKFIQDLDLNSSLPDRSIYADPHSLAEHEELSKNNFWEKTYWGFQAEMLKVGSWFSDALKVGTDTGYDSGSTLDYVYENKPTSKSRFGRLIDKVYLSAIGWRGIRIRKQNIEKAYELCARLLKEQDASELKLMDIAAGHGRYMLEYLASKKEMQYTATLSDYSELNVQKGLDLIASLSLKEKVNFVKGDAFNFEYVKELATGKNVATVSGLYELYDSNDIVLNSLKGIFSGLDVDGYLVYTNQPWHPQLKFIAKVLTSHRNGQPWVMRRRSQWEMDSLVEAAGFEKIHQYTDPFGIFTVSVAKKKL